VILVHDLAAHTCLTKSEFSSFAMLIVQLRTHEQLSEIQQRVPDFVWTIVATLERGQGLQLPRRERHFQQ